jgi:uncharacterized membrane protein YdbT with pleckstrin-like domain
MKQCSYCGKEYADDAVVCSVDGQSLVGVKPVNNSNSNSQEPPSDFGIRLMDGEEVIFSLRPYRFVWFAVVQSAITIVGIPFVPFALIWASIAERRYHYWLTNKRVIWCHGFIGYQVRSVPLERIADVVISRTFPEMVAGISSIDIRDMTGQTQIRNAFGSGLSAKWIGVQDAPEIQKRILEQIKQVNENTKKL